MPRRATESCVARGGTYVGGQRAVGTAVGRIQRPARRGGQPEGQGEQLDLAIAPCVSEEGELVHDADDAAAGGGGGAPLMHLPPLGGEDWAGYIVRRQDGRDLVTRPGRHGGR